jgi:hypothetical protein
VIGTCHSGIEAGTKGVPRSQMCSNKMNSIDAHKFY